MSQIMNAKRASIRHFSKRRLYVTHITADLAYYGRPVRRLVARNAILCFTRVRRAVPSEHNGCNVNPILFKIKMIFVSIAKYFKTFVRVRHRHERPV